MSFGLTNALEVFMDLMIRYSCRGLGVFKGFTNEVCDAIWEKWEIKSLVCMALLGFGAN